MDKAYCLIILENKNIVLDRDIFNWAENFFIVIILEIKNDQNFQNQKWTLTSLLYGINILNVIVM